MSALSGYLLAPEPRAVAVRLRWRAENRPAAAVEVLDSDLRSHASLVVSAEPVTVTLSPPGRYLVRGWLPNGDLIEATLDTADDLAVPVDLRAVESPIDTPAPRLESARWALPWRRTDDRWTPTGPPVALGEEHRALIRRPDDAGSPLAIQLGTADGPTFVVMALCGVRLRVAQRVDRAEAVVTPDAGLASTLLAYLDAGDVRSAGIIASRMFADEPGHSGEPLHDLALGYYLLRTGDKRFAAWARALPRKMPHSPDARILAAYGRLRADRGGLRTGRRQLLSAAQMGIPVVAAGVRLLADGLAGFDEQPRRDGEVSAALNQIRRYQRALVPGVFTTYTALQPDAPLPGIRLPVNDSAEIGSATRCALQVDEEPERTSSRWRAQAQRWWEVAQARLAPAAVFTTVTLTGIVERSLAEILLGPIISIIMLLPSIGRLPDFVRGRDSDSGTSQVLSVDLQDIAGDYPLADLRRLFMHTDPLTEYEATPDEPRTPPQRGEAPPVLISLPRLHLVGPRAAGRTDEPPGLTHTDEPTGLRIVLRQTTHDTVEATARLSSPRTEKHVLLQVRATTEGTASERLMILSTDSETAASGDVILRGAREWLDLAIVAIRTASSLGDDDLETVRRSVPATGRRGRNAWRAVAKDRDDSDPLVAAIAAGLR